MRPTELSLDVHVPAEEWAYCQRRLIYLESLLLRLVRDRNNIQEWFQAGELADLCLPGLPDNRAGMARRAKANGWRVRHFGRLRLYHVTSLPPRAFDALIARIVGLPEIEQYCEPLPNLPPMPRVETPAPAPAAPVWVLPLMSLMRGKAHGDLGTAWRELPNHVPRGTVLPTPDEAASVLVELGLSEKLANWREH